MKYAILIEKTNNGSSAYVPDLPGCIAAADTKTEVEELIREVIVLHLGSLHEHGDPIPEPHTTAALIEVQPLYDSSVCADSSKAQRPGCGKVRVVGESISGARVATVDPEPYPTPVAFLNTSPCHCEPCIDRTF